MPARPRQPKELVLLGGGHAHVEVVRSFGLLHHRHNQRANIRHAAQQPQSAQQMSPISTSRLDSGEEQPPYRVTLVNRGRYTPYSGMLPGHVSGFYSYEDCHIDLAHLARSCGASMVLAEACGLDLQARHVLFADRPPLPYDVLSIDIGITPGRGGVPGAEEHTTPVKPIDGFVQRLENLLERHRETASKDGKGLRVCVVGGGAGGIELAAAVQYRLEEERRKAGWAAAQARDSVCLVCRGGLLPGHPPHVRRLVARLLQQQGVEVRHDDAVARVEAGALELESGACVAFDECLWCTEAAPAAWLRDTGLPTDERGFLAINEFLQSEGGPPEVFAAGDVASCAKHPRPKAGVFAVRQGPALAANLQAFLEGRPMQPFKPQETALALISLGSRYAVASITGTRALADQHGRKWLSGLSRTATPSTTGDSGVSQETAAVSNAVDSHATHGGRPSVGGAAAVPQVPAARRSQWWAGWLLNGCGGAGAIIAGPLLWQWKDSIDRAFMRKYGSGLRLPRT